MIWKRNENRPKTGPSPLEKFKTDLAHVVSDAEDAGVLAVHIARQLQSAKRYGLSIVRRCVMRLWGVGEWLIAKQAQSSAGSVGGDSASGMTTKPVNESNGPAAETAVQQASLAVVTIQRRYVDSHVAKKRVAERGL